MRGNLNCLFSFFEQIKAEEVDIFLKGGGALDISSIKKKPKVSVPSDMLSRDKQ